MSLSEKLTNFDWSFLLVFLSYAITVLLLVVTLVGQIFEYVGFLQNDGYAGQIEAFQNPDASKDGIVAFTETQGSSFSNLVGIIQFVLCVAQIVVLSLNLIAESETLGKVLTAVVSVPVLAAIVLVVYGSTELSHLWPIPENSLFYQFLTENGPNILYAGMACALILVIASFVHEDTRPLAQFFAIGLGLWLAILLVFWLLQNFIPLGSWIRYIIAAAIAAVLVVFSCIVALGGVGSSDNSSGASSTSLSSSKPSTPSRKPSQRTLTYSISDPRFAGTERPDSFGCMVKGVWFKDVYGRDQRACSIQDFEEGKVAIVNKGKRVTDIPGCKTPKR